MKRTMLVAVLLTIVACRVDQAPAPEIQAAESRSSKPIVVPAFALIPIGPDSARILWVPWGNGVRYMLELAEGDDWVEIEANVFADSAVLTDLSDGQHVRVVAIDDTTRIGESVPLMFTPASKSPSTLQGRALVDGKGQGWTIEGNLVTGHGNAPSVGDLLLPAVGPGTMNSTPLEVVIIESNTTRWQAQTRPFVPQSGPHLGSAKRSRGGATVNVSMDGLPTTLSQTRPGFVGHCSASGWGCFEVPAADFAALPTIRPEPGHQQGRFAQTDLTANSLSWSRIEQGLSLSTTVQGGVILMLDYDFSLFSSPMLSSISATAVPYVNGEVSASMTTTASEILFAEQLYASPLVTLATGWGFSLNAQFGMSALADLQSEGAVEGAWSGSFETRQSFEVGYRSGEFFGPEPGELTAYVQVTPTFGDGSKGDLWVGWRAEGSIVLTGFSLEIARATLAPTLGLVLHHASTPGAPCNEPISIAHTRIDAGMRLDAILDVVLLGQRTFRLYERREPLLGWGRTMALTMEERTNGTSDIAFRLRPGPPPSLATGGVDLTEPLQAFVEGVPLSSTSRLEQGRFVLTPGLGELTSGTTPTFAVWLPDVDYPGTDLLGAPGLCVSKPLSVEVQ